jgi:ATP-binding cassette, subfamily B, vacuolar membrane transporter HMT1/ACLQ
MASTTGQDYVSLDKAREVLYITKATYPAVVFGVFLLAFIIYGVMNAPSDDDKVEVHTKRGPGGRPLPLRRKSASQAKEAVKVTDFSPNAKLIFRAISAGVLVSFVVNGAAIVLQVLIYRDDRWWPGQSAVVSLAHESFFKTTDVWIDLRGGFILCVVNCINILD